MADYCSVDDVRALIPDVEISLTAKVKPAAVASWITSVSAALGVAYTAGGGTLPITDTNQLNAFKLLTSGEVGYIAIAVAGTVRDPKTKPLSDSWHDAYTAAIDSMTSGEAAAVIAAAASTESPYIYTMDADEEDSSDSRNPTFTKDYVP